MVSGILLIKMLFLWDIVMQTRQGALMTGRILMGLFFSWKQLSHVVQQETKTV